MSASSIRNTLVVANPGTGKTTQIAKKVVELLNDGILPERILCLTFTNKAVFSLIEKIKEVASKEGTEAHIDKLNVSTFHSYALNHLEVEEERKKIMSGNPLRYAIFHSLTENHAFNYERDYLISEVVPKFENAIRYVKSFGILPGEIRKKTSVILEQITSSEKSGGILLDDELSALLEFFIEAFEDYESWKGDRYDYGDLLINFTKQADWHNSYDYVLVDELQDVNELEAQIALHSSRNKYFVGDRKQAIFGFQGGTLGKFNELMDSSDWLKETLHLNYRSLNPILEYSKNYFLQNTLDQTHSDELSTFSPFRKGAGKVVVVEATETESAAVAIAESLTTSGRVAVIARTNGRLNEIEKIFDAKGIQYSSTSRDLFDPFARRDVTEFLEAILKPSVSTVMKGIMTPFSGVPLEVGLEISRTKDAFKTVEELESQIPEFAAIIRKVNNFQDLRGLFLDHIIPIATAYGMSYALTAMTIGRAVFEYLDEFDIPDSETFFDFLSVLDSNTEGVDSTAPLTLTTIHKAKGLEFDHVIYIPTASRTRLSYVDLVVRAIINATRNLEVQAELSEEPLRLDFVAFTRARESLHVIAETGKWQRFQIDGISTKTSFDQIVGPSDPRNGLTNYAEAFAQFVAGNLDRSRDLLQRRDVWLIPMIERYFKSTNKLSFSLLSGIVDPLQFLRSRILQLVTYNRAADVGTLVHKVAELRFHGHLEENKLEDVVIPYYKNLKNAVSSIEQEGYVQIGSEEWVDCSLRGLFSDDPDILEYSDLRMVGKMDAVFERKLQDGDSEYLIIDFKTGRKDDGSVARRQLLLYRKMYSIAKGVSEERIRCGVAFLGIRGTVNTGKIEMKLDFNQPLERQWSTLQKHLKTFLRCKKDPMTFAETLVSVKNTREPVDERLLEIIMKEVNFTRRLH